MKVLRGLQSMEESKEDEASQQNHDGSGFHEDQDERDRDLFDELIQEFETELGHQAEEN